MEEQEILIDVRDRVARITFNRPKAKNALHQAAVKKVLALLKRVSEDPDIWMAVLRGTGDAFCTGHDLKELAEPGHKEEITWDILYEAIRRTYKPIIAAINGTCVAGGSGIALSCDLRIMGKSGRLGWPQVKRGMSSVSGPAMLARSIPLNIAFEIMFRGDFVNAERALELKLVNAVVADDDLDRAVDQLIADLMKNAPLSMRAIKQATIESLDLPYADAMRFGVRLHQKLLESYDTQEGLKAFAEKREPVWQGR